MRTTLDIDDDVLAAAKELARHSGATAGQVISRLARESLQRTNRSHAREPRASHGIRPFASRGGIVTNELTDKLRDDDAG